MFCHSSKGRLFHIDKNTLSRKQRNTTALVAPGCVFFFRVTFKIQSKYMFISHDNFGNCNTDIYRGLTCLERMMIATLVAFVRYFSTVF